VDEIVPLRKFSVEMRKRVFDRLAVMKPEEFRGADFQSLEVVCPQEPRIGA
jgi:hypothetical protein